MEVLLLVQLKTRPIFSAIMKICQKNIPMFQPLKLLITLFMVPRGCSYLKISCTISPGYYPRNAGCTSIQWLFGVRDPVLELSMPHGGGSGMRGSGTSPMEKPFS